MTNAQVEVITSVQWRRRWSRAEKERIVAASLEPDAVASRAGRRRGRRPGRDESARDWARRRIDRGSRDGVARVAQCLPGTSDRYCHS
jgi:transposase-like protein